jgi:hypothetical protein
MHQNVKIRRKRLGTNKDALVVDTHDWRAATVLDKLLGNSMKLS